MRGTPVIRRLPTGVFLRESRMSSCSHCASPNVEWFTPQRYADRAAVLLCMTCRRLTIDPPRNRRVTQPLERERAA